MIHTTTCTAEDVLTIARKKIGKDWTTGTYGYSNGEVCALGAISFADKKAKGGKPVGMLVRPRDDNNGTYEAIKALYDALPAKWRKRYSLNQSRESYRRHDNWTMMTNAIMNYNDARDKNLNRKHIRTITKWFDRALRSVQDK